MTKVKVFKFEVSNSSCNKLKGDENTEWYVDSKARLSSEEDIENTINSFINGFTHSIEIVDIKINNIDTHYHNNARGNIIHLMYTIIYK